VLHLVLASLVALGSVACAGGQDGPQAATTSRPSADAGRAGDSAVHVPATGPDAIAPEPGNGLRGTLLQFRRDVPARRLQLRLTADVAGLVVEGVDLLTPGLPGATAAPLELALRPDTPVDVPVPAGASDCTVDPGAPSARVRLRNAAGDRREVTVPLDDGGLVRRLHEADCAEQELRAQAAVEVVGVTVAASAEGPALDVVVRLSRVGGSSPVRVTGIGSNTVYSITALGPLPTLGPRGSVDLDLRLLPARCDVHALGESYRTGLIGLVLALGDGEPRPYGLIPEDGVRSRLEAFAVETCRARTE
jgi:hypothetical protein